MTQSPRPNDPRRDRPQATNTGPSRPLTFDEMVALFVAFLSLGSVLFWGLTRTGINLFNESLVSANSNLIAPEDSSEKSSLQLVPETAATEQTLPSESPNSETTRFSAREQLAAQSASKQESTDTSNPSAAIRAGGAGAAAGVAGVATTNADNDTTPSETLTADEAASSETAPQTTESTPDQNSGLTLSEAVTTSPAEAVSFRDVPDNYWAKPYIDALSSRGIISGFAEGDFQPEQPVTRAQIATVVANTFDLTTDKENLEFSDVKEDYWAKESIGEVVRGGFMSGFPNDTFDPNAPVTRAQAFTTLVTGLNAQVPTNIQTSLSRYADASDIPQWANEKIAAATGSGFIVNYPTLTQLNPNEATTRAELAVMIYQALTKEGALEPIDSEYIVKP